MGSEIVQGARDLLSYARVLYERNGERFRGDGVDYRGVEYRDTARRVVSRIHPPSMELSLKEIVRETASAQSFRFERLDAPLPPFRAGQYVNLFVEVDGVRTSRPYSIASPPGSDTLDITVRHKPDGFVSPYLLGRVQAGQVFQTSGPAGSFYHEPLTHGRHLVFLAGGSGITPFMSMIRHNEKCGGPLKIHLLYGNRDPGDVIFGKELSSLAVTAPWFEYTPVFSDPPEGFGGLSGFLDASTIRETIGGAANQTFYLCGPGAMYDFCSAALAELGVPARRVRRERYGPPEDVTLQPGWPEGLAGETEFRVEIEGAGALVARAGEPLLNVLEREGYAVPAACRSGGCSLCRTKLLQGRVYMPEQTALRESDRLNGYIHPCVSYPLENLMLRLPG